MQKTPWSFVAILAACLLLVACAAEEHSPGAARSAPATTHQSSPASTAPMVSRIVAT